MGDITLQDTTAVVNAADSSLLGGTGVDGAIHQASGPLLAPSVKALNGCRMGRAKSTPGFNLAARYIIHTVAPVYNDTDIVAIEKSQLSILHCCFTACVELADLLECSSIAFPALGAGGFGWPITVVAGCASQASVGFRCRHVKEVRFVAFGPHAFQAFSSALNIKGTIQCLPGTLRYHTGVSATDPAFDNPAYT